MINVEMEDENQENPEGAGEYGNFIEVDYLHSFIQPEESTTEVYTCMTKWRKVPRHPSDFSDCRTPVSSMRDSDYENWLIDYYEELYKADNQKNYVDKMTDTCEIDQPITSHTKSNAFSIFTRTAPKESPKYQAIEDTRRHWPLSKTLKEYLLFPATHPLLNISSRSGRYFTILHSSSGIPEQEYKKRLLITFKANLLRAKIFSYQLAKIVLCDNLVLIPWFDYLSKKMVITTLCQFLRNQRYLEIATFENARLHQLEGIVLLCALSRSVGDILKELHIWKMFRFGQCPVLKDKLSILAKSRSRTKTRGVDLKYHFMEILNNFSSLTHLSINYAYLANQSGDALLCLKSVRNGNLREIRLLCLPEERPLLTNPNYGTGGCQISDGTWRRAREWNPNLRVKFVFLNMPQYENIILFLSKNIPVSSFSLTTGIDLKFKQPWEIDSTLLELRNWYSDTLETLNLHLWHHRDLIDYVIEYKILDEFPNLLNFEFIGILKCFSTLEGFCKRLLTRKYKLAHLLFWVEEEYSNQKNRKDMVEKIEEVKRTYLNELRKIQIDAYIRIYPG